MHYQPGDGEKPTTSDQIIGERTYSDPLTGLEHFCKAILAEERTNPDQLLLLEVSEAVSLHRQPNTESLPPVMFLKQALYYQAMFNGYFMDPDSTLVSILTDISFRVPEKSAY